MQKSLFKSWRTTSPCRRLMLAQRWKCTFHPRHYMACRSVQAGTAISFVSSSPREEMDRVWWWCTWKTARFPRQGAASSLSMHM